MTVPAFLKNIRTRTWLGGCTIAAQTAQAAMAAAGQDASSAGLVMAGSAALLGTAANVAVNLLSTDLHQAVSPPPRQDAATLGRWRHHDLTRACGHAIADIVTHYAQEQPREGVKRELLALAEALPDLYATATEMPFLPGAEEAEDFHATGDWLHAPTAETADWVGFLHYAAQEAGVVFTSAGSDAFLQELGMRLHAHFRQQLHEYFARDASAADSPTGGRAHAKLVLAQLSGILQRLHRMEEKIDRLLERDAIARYRKHLRDCFDVHEVIGLPRPGSESDPGNPPVRSIYVPPACATSHITPETLHRVMLDRGTMQDPTSPLLPWLSQHQRIILLGDPGMGKSTLVRWLISTLAAEDRPAEGGALWGVTPLPFILRDVLRHMQDTPAEQWTWDTLWEAFLQYRPDGKLSEPLAQPLKDAPADRRDLMDSDRVLFLLDGLDEVGSHEHRRHLQRVIWEGFRRYPKARWLITSRVIGYGDAPVDLMPMAQTDKESSSSGVIDLFEARAFETGDILADTYRRKTLVVRVGQRLYLAPFDDARQEAFAQRWFLSRMGPTGGPVRAALLMEKLRSHRSGSTQVIGRVPNLLLLMALLFQNRVHLPDGRAKLYDEISQAYLEEIDRDYGLDVPYARAKSETCLARIAMHMQLGREAAAEAEAEEARWKPIFRQSETEREVTATEAELRAWLRGCITPVGDPCHDQAIDDFLSHIARRSGLLISRAPRVYGFTHLSFQEYYTACNLEKEFHRLIAEDELEPAADDADTLPAVKREDFARWADSPLWRESLVFLVEKFEGNSPFTRKVMRWMFPQGTSASEKTGTGKDYTPPYPEKAAQLLAALTVDKQVTLTPPQRQAYWEALWQAQLAWDAETRKDSWCIAPVLLESTDFQAGVMTTLLRCWKDATTLNLSGCPGLSSVDGVAGLPQLQRLSLRRCTGLSSVDALSGLSQLQRLDLSECTGLNSVGGLSGLSHLLMLKLCGWTGLSSVDGLAGLSQLRYLDLRYCTGLNSVDALAGLSHLHTLGLSHCTGLSSVDGLAALTQLQELDLDGCTGLSSVDGLAALTQLQELDLSGCAGLSSVDALARLSHLQTLNLSGCTGLSSVDALIGLLQLRELHLYGCTGLSSVDSLVGLSHLQYLDLSGCTGLSSVDVLAGLSGLKSLDLSGCTDISADEVQKLRLHLLKCDIVHWPVGHPGVPF